MDWKLQPQGTLVAYWAFLGVPGAFPGVPFSPACWSPGSSAVTSVEALAALSPGSKCARVCLCFTTHTAVSLGLVPLFTTDCQGQAVLADGPTSFPHSTEPLHARLLEILSWWLSGHLSALAFLESSCPFRHLLPDLVLSPLSTPCSSALSTGQPCVPGFCF